jgi:hypothetical protein
MYDLDPMRWQTLACRIAGRPLTITEWNKHFPGRPYRPACTTAK